MKLGFDFFFTSIMLGVSDWKSLLQVGFNSTKMANSRTSKTGFAKNRL